MGGPMIDPSGRLPSRKATTISASVHLPIPVSGSGVYNIPPGVDFREHIDETLDQSDVVLAIVGPRWVGSHSGRDRLSEPSDPVRVEVETALQKRKPLIPVLVLNAHMPTVEHLPSSLHDFAYRNAVTIDAERDFDVHMARLIRSIDRIAKKPRPTVPADSNC